MTAFIPAANISADINNEPRILDTDLAHWLGMPHTRNIRMTIAANYAELLQYGDLHSARVHTGKPGRPGMGYHLNEGQALVLCALSRADQSAAVRKALISAFLEFRQGKVVDVAAHKRRKPATEKADEYQELFQKYHKGLVDFRGHTDALLEMFAGAMARIEILERRMKA